VNFALQLTGYGNVILIYRRKREEVITEDVYG